MGRTDRGPTPSVRLIPPPLTAGCGRGQRKGRQTTAEGQKPAGRCSRPARLGIVGTRAVSGYGCPGLTRLQSGLVAYELSRGGGSVNTLNAVQPGLVIGTIARLGDEEQKQRWLPRLAALD